MTEIAEAGGPIKRMTGCRACARPTGEFVAPGEEPTRSYCTDCEDLPLPWTVQHDRHGHITEPTWDMTRRQNTDTGAPLAADDMWAEPLPDRPAGVARNAFTARVNEVEDLLPDLELEYDAPIDEGVANVPRCACGSFQFHVIYKAEGELKFNAWGDEVGEDAVLHPAFERGLATITEYDRTECAQCHAEYYGEIAELVDPERAYRVRP